MIICNKPEIQCYHCGYIISLDSDQFDCDCNYFRQGPMGDEYLHTFHCSDYCPKCNSPIAITIHGYEYPIGAYNNHDYELDNCSFVIEPELGFENITEDIVSVYNQIIIDSDYLFALDPYQFEKLVADIFCQKGFDAEVTQKTRDGGKDIIATFQKSGLTYTTYFECKQYAPTRPVGVSVVRELYGVLTKDLIDKGVIVTTSYFARDAILEAQRLNGRIELIDGKDLLRIIQSRD